MTVTGEFTNATVARQAVSRLHAAGVTEDDIAFLLAGSEQEELLGPERRMQDAERTGARIGSFAADVSRTAAELVPFVGRNIADSPLGRALRDATETSGAMAGRLVGAASEGGFVGSDPAGAPRTRALVSVRATSDRVPALTALLMDAGAVNIRTEG